jgi:hypothetical protein
MFAQTLHLRKLMLFAFLSVADLGLTFRLLHTGGGRIYEGNPIANACLTTYGWPGLMVFKLLSVLVVSGLALWIAQRRPALGGGVLAFACWMLSGVVVYSCSLTRLMGS